MCVCVLSSIRKDVTRRNRERSAYASVFNLANHYSHMSSSSSRKDDQPTQTVVLERFEDVRVADELPRPP